MVFSSLTFLYFFLPVALLIYFVAPKKLKNFVLLISSLVFYAWGEPIYIILLLISTVIIYSVGLLMNKFDRIQKLRTILLIVTLVINIGLIAVFNYSSAIIATLNSLFGIDISDPELPLPIGLSFYTFQAMSYVIDLYLRKVKVQKNIINLATYIVMFPKVLAGPIVRYSDIDKEIENRTITTSKIADGIGVFVKGLGKKVILANNIGLVWAQVKVMGYDEISVLTAWVGIFAFTFKIYFDFSGYSDMAIGLGKMLGFKFPQNFNHPYVSKSVSEFWRRWHITLGSWFRSYVYIPLGGNKHGMLKTIRNILIVWLLLGLWHGASWNYIIWGMYFGVLIIIERLGWGKVLSKLPSAISKIYTFFLVVIGWVFFDIKGLGPAFKYLKAMFGSNGDFIDSTSKYLIGTNLILFIVCIIASTDLIKKLYFKLKSLNGNIMQYVLPILQFVIMIISTAYLVNSETIPFIYFSF